MKTHGFTEFVAAFTHIDLGQHRAKAVDQPKNPVATSDTALIMPNQSAVVIQQLTPMKFADMRRRWMAATLLVVEVSELLVPVEGANPAVIQGDAVAVRRLWRGPGFRRPLKSPLFTQSRLKSGLAVATRMPVAAPRPELPLPIRAWPSFSRLYQRDDCIRSFLNPSRVPIDYLELCRIRPSTDCSNLIGIYKKNSRFFSGFIRPAKFD
jgi:hypothetical protein